MKPTPAKRRHLTPDLPPPRVRSAIVDRFVAGDALYTLAWDYDLTPSVVEGCLREALKMRAGKGVRQ